MGSWKDISPEERARLVAIAINESGLDVKCDVPDGEATARVDAEGIRIIAEAIREAQEAVRK